MSDMNHILVVDDDRALAELLRRILVKEGYDVTVVYTAEEAFQKCKDEAFAVALVDVMLPAMDGYTLCRTLRQHPDIKALPILMLTAKGDIADRIAGFEAGADDYLTKPFQPKELAFRVRSLLARAQTPIASSATDTGRGYVLAVFGSKGGVGKTTIATNLAVSLRERSHHRVALLDADFFSGDVGVHMNLPTISTILDLTQHDGALEPALADQVMVPHPSGVHVLLSPFRPEEGNDVTPQQLGAVVDFLAGLYEYVVVDCQPSYDQRMLGVLERADDVLLVVTPEVGPLKNTSLFLEWAARLKFPLSKMNIVVNRFNSNVGIGSEEIERTLQHEVSFRIISGGRPVVMSVNRGVPLVIEQPEHPFSMQVMRIADHYIERAGDAPATTSARPRRAEV